MQEEMQHFLALYTHTFPQKVHVQVTTCTNMSTGWEGDLLALSLAYEEERECRTEEVILKLYYGQSGTKKARKEFRSLQQLAQIGYPVPHALFAALEDSPFGRAALAMEKIQGDTAEHIFERLSQQQQRALVAHCCQLYLDLHKLNWEPLVPDSARYQSIDSIHTWLTRAKADCEQQLPHVFDPVMAWLEERRPEVSCQHLSVIHGDFHLNNLVMRDDGVLFVIDWTGTGISDYRFDLAWTLLLQRSQGAVNLADMMLGEYERLLGHHIEQLEFFEVIACFKRLFDIAVSLQNGATTLGMKPGAEEEMKQQVNRIQAVYAQLQERIARPLPEIEQLILTLVRI
ncbi:MAG: phosphotransferase family protein, partial [Ktedonobacteraceae bacterium]